MRHWIHSKRWALSGLGIYLLLTVWLTLPSVLAPRSQIPIGTEPTATVPLLNVWSIWWNTDQLGSLYADYWQAPIFFPVPDAFAMSEPHPLTALLAPVIWITGSSVLAYNVLLWLSLLLNGVMAQRLLRLYGIRPAMALWGGAAMLLLPIVHWQLGVIQLVPLWGILWTWGAVEQLCRRPTLRRGVVLGIAFATSFLMCMHQGLLLALVLPAGAPALWRLARRWRRTVPAGAVALLVVLILSGPFAWKIGQVAKRNGFERARDIVEEQSARPSDYLQAHGGQLLQLGPGRPGWRMLSPGTLKLGLALLGIFFGLRRLRFRRWAVFLLLLAVASFVLSLGPHLRLGAWQPWWTLVDVLPGFGQVRNVFRFAFFVQMAVVVFAALGLYQLHRVCLRRLAGRRARLAGRVGLGLLGLVALLEIPARRGVFAMPPNPAQHAAWLAYVNEQTPDGHAIACFPFAQGLRAAEFQPTTEWMYLSTFHGQALVNGYSGNFPIEYLRLREDIATAFPTPEILQRLFQLKVAFLVLKRSPNEPDGAAKSGADLVIGDYRIEQVLEDKFVRVYRLAKTTSP